MIQDSETVDSNPLYIFDPVNYSPYVKLVHTSGAKTRDGKSISDHPAAMLERARRWVLDLFNDHGDTRLVWHNFARTNQLVTLSARLATDDKLDEVDLLALYTAAWFSYTGWLFDPSDPLTASRQLARQFLHAEHQPDALQDNVHEVLGAVNMTEPPISPVGRILWDAVLALHVGPDYSETQKLRKKEQENILRTAISNEQWRQEEVLLLRTLSFFTAEGKATFEPELARHLQSLERRQEKAEKPVVETVPAKSNGNSTIQTYFKTSYHTHIHLSGIADRKAQMLISVNAILISVLITVLSYSNIAETRPPLLIPVTLFMVFGLSALVFAVLSARPKVTRQPIAHLLPEERRSNLLFFGHFTQLDPDDYIREMNDLFEDPNELQSAMHRDMYFLGKVMDRKYRLVSMAYTLFLIGFIGAVCSFLIVQFVFL